MADSPLPSASDSNQGRPPLGPARSPSGKKESSPKSVAKFLLFCLVVLVVPSFIKPKYHPSAPIQPSPYYLPSLESIPPNLVHSQAHRGNFDNMYIEMLKNRQPDFLFLGNSELDSMIDRQYIDEILKPRRSGFIIIQGSTSAIWYLLLKHHVIPSGVRPRCLFLGFRYTVLTMPGERLKQTWDKVTTLIGEEDPVFDKIVAGPPLWWEEWLDAYLNLIYPFRQNRPPSTKKALHLARIFDEIQCGFPFRWKERVERWADRLYPIQRDRTAYTTRALDLARYGWNFLPNPTRHLDDKHKAEVQRQEALGDVLFYTRENLINELFSLDNTRSNTPTVLRETPKIPSLNFQKDCGHSFLPPIIDLAQSNNIKLCFICLKGNQHEPRSFEYMEDLQIYLKSRGCLLVSFEDDEEIQESWFTNGSHIKEEFRKRCTDKLLQKIPEAFQ